jgi:hypothetical protein
MSFISRPHLRAGALVGAIALAATIGGAAMAGTSSDTLSNGAALSVSLTSPLDGDTFLVPAGDTDVDVPVTGSASIGKGEPNVHWTYVVDVSGSTVGPCAGTTILTCEKQAVTNLNNTIKADGSAKDVGLAVFAGQGASADMTSAAGPQPLTTPADLGVNTVIGSIGTRSIGQFTPYSVTDLTNFAAGLNAAHVSVAASTATSKNVVFLSDGVSNAGGSAFNAAVSQMQAQGATIYSFAVGSGASCTGGSQGTLQQMAAATGGTCTNVSNPANLPAIVQNVTATQMTDVSLTVDGANTAFGTISPTPPFDGPETAAFTATAADQAPGEHEACASATGLGPKSEAGSERTVQRCESYDVFGFGLTPATATNELGSDDTHTVTATVSGEPGKVEGWPVSFAVTGQNAGATGTCVPAACTTDSDGEVTFTYTVPVAPSSLGTDDITATVEINDEQGSLTVEKEWQDTTPPTATCVPGPNPGGKIPAAPGKGGQGQNQDGFWTLSATDDVWGSTGLDVYVDDDGSTKVFGPYANPTNIKYTEANGAQPTERPGTGAVDHVLRGRGDAMVYAVDGSGNAGPAVACLVPPAPQ